MPQPLIVRNDTIDPVLCLTQKRGAEVVVTRQILPQQAIETVNVPLGLWVAFFSVDESGRHLVASAILEENVISATLMRSTVDIEVMQQGDPETLFIVENTTSQPVRCEVQQGGSSSITRFELAPAGEEGSRWNPDAPDRLDLWMGFFRNDGAFIASTFVHRSIAAVRLIDAVPAFSITTITR